MLAELYPVADKIVLSLGSVCATILLVIPIIALCEILRRCRTGPVPHPLMVLFFLVLSLAAFIVLTDAMAHWLDLVV